MHFLLPLPVPEHLRHGDPWEIAEATLDFHAEALEQLSAQPEVISISSRAPGTRSADRPLGFLALDVAEVTAVVEVVRHVIDDIERLAALGGWFFAARERIRNRSNGHAGTVTSERSAGALGTYGAVKAGIDLTGFRYSESGRLRRPQGSNVPGRWIWTHVYVNQTTGQTKVFMTDEDGRPIPGLDP